MPFTTSKPVILICGSRNIVDLNISRYIRPSSVGAVISGGAIGVDSIARDWAKQNDIEYIEYNPNYKTFGRKAPLVRDEQMVNACDIVFAFWDLKSKGTEYTLKYAQSIGRKCIVHWIDERD